MLNKRIRKKLADGGNKENSEQSAKYFKHVLKFHGVKTPRLKDIFKDIYDAHIKSLDLNDQLELACDLIASKYGEEKRFGVEILLKNVKRLDKGHVKRIEKLFENDVYDWGTCDGLAGMLFGRMIKRDPTVSEVIHPWKDSSNMWKQRASCVSFVPVARFGEFNDLIVDIVSACVKNDERFVQLGAGWVLRELSLADLDLVVEFIKKNYKRFSREGLRYAIEKMNPERKKELMGYGKS